MFCGGDSPGETDFSSQAAIRRVFRYNVMARCRKVWVGEQTADLKPSGLMPGERIIIPGRQPEPGDHVFVRGKLCRGGQSRTEALPGLCMCVPRF